MNTLDLSIIIINYKTSTYTLNCIESIFSQTSKNLNFEIIVIDNNSSISDFLMLEESLLKSNHSNVKLIRSQINSGFGGGNMYGAGLASGKFLCFLNNDSLLLNDCFSIIIEQMNQNHEYGVCAPQAYKEDGKLLPTIDHFSSPIKELFGRNFLEFINPDKYPKRKKEYILPQRGQSVSGSFMIFHTSDFWKIGGFDTNLFLYQEETDICLRLLKLKKFAYLIPEAKFIHFHGASTKKSIAIKTELKISSLYVIRKHYGFFSHLIILFFLQTKYFIRSFFKPKYWSLFFVMLKGGHLSYSLKQKQHKWDSSKN